MTMRRITAIIMMACILMTGCSSAPATEATQAPATEATQAPATEAAQAPATETTQTPVTEASQAVTTADQATVQTTTETSTEQDHVEPYGIYTVYYEDKEVQLEWDEDAITFIIGTARYTEEKEDWMEKTYEILSNPQKKVNFEDELAYDEDDKFIKLETPSGTVFKFDELPKSTSEWFMVNIEPYLTITSLEESF